jgi:hypothetical protein
MIFFSCACGKLFRTQESYAGEVVVCPECGAKSVVPQPDGTGVRRRPE